MNKVTSRISLTKTLFFFLMTSLMTSMTMAQSQAVEYLDELGKFHHDISKDMWDYSKAAARGKSARKVEGKRIDLIETNMKAQKGVRVVRPFNGSTELRDSVLSYLKLSCAVLKEDYAKIIDMEAIAEESYDAMEAYVMAKQAAGDKLEEASDMLNTQIEDFAKEHGITLQENNSKLSQKLKQSGKMFEYYNKVFLIYFKASYSEGMLVQAMNTGNVNEMEQARTALIDASTEGLTALDTTESFDGDNSLVIATKEILQFYQKMASNEIGEVINFYIKKETFEKVTTAFDSKSKKDRTQQDVDAYNQAVEEYNASIDSFNKSNEKFNKERVSQFETWERKSTDFTTEHSKI